MAMKGMAARRTMMIKKQTGNRPTGRSPARSA
jgi:hypothetical protein